ncbi:hypothetical protein [Nonomuraea dietziae]|uniref:DUF8094 domain-containing protein n=1 Tax=Nonomuraea dietziae TaxID=65515 RepID=A0A7W5V4D3_9ACTN|nr:hypothetical protein [Nonomuraea dietziae]MBB3727145.1 hypothetical protein [Nonomuraea dietziae]
MRKASLAAVLTVSLAGCTVVPSIVAQRAAAPASPSPAPSASPSSPSSPSPASSTPAPSPTPSPARLTVQQARQAAAGWLAEHNKTVKDRDWWDDDDKRDTLFADGMRHEIVLDKGHVEDGQKNRARKPIRLTGRQTYYVPSEQPEGVEWFLLHATYQGQDRAHILAFSRLKGESFKLAAKTPLHYGQRIPAPKLDADGYVTAAPIGTGTTIAQEYKTFWNYSTNEKAGRSGYRLAKDNYSRRAFARVSKGMYMGYDSFTRPYGFHTRDGGSFYVFSLLNDPQSITQVLTLGAYVRGGSKSIQEIAGDWYA